MKKLIYVLLITLLIALPCFSKQSDADREIARTQDYIAAATKKGTAKINALNAYIKKFPDTTQRWTRMAYYSLAIGNYEIQNYGEAIKQGMKRLNLGNFGPGEEGRLLLVIANCYGIKGTSFNKDKALEYTKKAIAQANKDGDKDVLKTAQNLKKQLSGPPPKRMSPEQKIKMHYSDEEYSEAISYYKTLGASDKSNPEIHKTYANSLFKANSLDFALKEFLALYSKEKKAIYALRLGDIYAKKGRWSKGLLDKAVNYYLEGGLLYKEEGNTSNMKVAFSKGQYQLFEKYDFNKKVKRLEDNQRKNKTSAQKNEAAIREKKRELRKTKREIRKQEAQGIAAPIYLEEKVAKLEKEIEILESGGSADDTDEAAKLEGEKQKIQREFEELKIKIKKQLGL